MSGSESSNENMASGRVNRAEDLTRIWAQRTEEQEFNGTAIFIAEVADVPLEEPDPDEIVEWHPTHPVDGIVGRGWSYRSVGAGTGVIGLGGAEQGTGVFGHGGGAASGGTGGVGVHGLGGRNDSMEFTPVPPGPGVVGQGGTQTLDSTSGLGHGPGVVALAGARAIPPLEVTGNIGVYAEGADAAPTTVTGDDGKPVVQGVPRPGPGVLGRGGQLAGNAAGAADGIVGLAGGVPIPSTEVLTGRGVYGEGKIGVYGKGSSIGLYGNAEGHAVVGYSQKGFGVFGNSATTNGGAFQSDTAAQIQLMPHPIDTTLPAPQPVAPTALSPKAVTAIQLQLPKSCEPGDVYAVQDTKGTGAATLWFCVQRNASTGVAKWAQVLLGPLIDGQ